MQDEAPEGHPQERDGEVVDTAAATSPTSPATGGTDLVAQATMTDTPSVPVPSVAPAAPHRAALDVRNEALPATPPEIGTGPVGSIPAARARAAWTRVQALNWRLFLVRFLSAGLAVVLTVVIVPGLGFIGWRWGLFTQIAVIFGLLNATVKPLLQFLVLRFIFSTYGIVVVIINTLLLVLLAALLEGTFEASRPVSVLFGGLVVGVLGLILETLLGATPPTLDRDYKERNGLS